MARHFLITLAVICVFAVFCQAHVEELKNKNLKKVEVEKPEIENIERATSVSV